MPTCRVLVSCIVPCLAAACVFDKERRPLVDVNVAAASSYVFRGQTFTTRPVAQVDTLLRLPTKDGGTASLGGFGNLDLDDEVGRAWAVGDRAGEFTQLDLWTGYGRRVGGVDVLVGLRYYGWPDGERYPFAPFPTATSEVFARLGTEIAGCGTALTAHYDIDAITALYARAEVTRTLELGEDLALEPQLWLGWSDQEHSLWLYRTAGAGLADLGGSLALRWQLDELTAARLAVSGSTIVDDAMRDWFAGRVDADVVWVTASLGWAL